MTNPLTALGKWANAPLALVVAQVRFTPTPESDFRIVATFLQQALKTDFPNVSDVEQITVTVGSDGESAMTDQRSCVGTDLVSGDGLSCIRVQNDSVTISTSAYEGWESFLAVWRKVLDALSATGTVTTTRIGLRYLDFILPSADREPEDYVAGGLGRAPDGLPPVQINVSLYEYERPLDGRLRIQYSRGFGLPMLPPDLLGTVPPAPALQLRYTGGASAILDMDRSAMLNKPVTAEELARVFAELRRDISETFHCIISPLALAEWQGNPQEV